MKFNTALLLSFCVLPSALWAFEDKQAYQLAYNFCLTDVINKSDIRKFRRKLPEEQGEECINRLRDEYPEELEGLDLEKFKEGFFDDRYRVQR